MSIAVNKYAIRDQESLQDIAQQQLGDRSRWLDIIALNKLRAPYISQDPLAQFGPVLGTLQLQNDLTAGASTIDHWDATSVSTSQTLLVPGNIIAFSKATSNGDISYDSAIIDSVSKTVAAGTAHLLLAFTLLPIDSYRSFTREVVLSTSDGMKQTHVSGEQFQVYGNPFLLSTSVAKVGDLISLPVPRGDQSSNINTVSIHDVVDSLGVDVSLDSQGQKTISSSGDIGTVVGVDNLKQAIRIRIDTVPGELGLHSDYGCMLQYYIGTPQDSNWSGLAKAMLNDCLLQEPRIRNILDISLSFKGDVTSVHVDLEAAQGGQVVSDIIPLTT